MNFCFCLKEIFLFLGLLSLTATCGLFPFAMMSNNSEHPPKTQEWSLLNEISFIVSSYFL